MEELIAAALREAERSGVAYADVRWHHPWRYEQLAVRDGEASALTRTVRGALGVRARTDRAWGFATTARPTRAGARETARRAIRLAQVAGRSTHHRFDLTEERGPENGRYSSALEIDPFEVPLEEKIGLLTEAEKRLHVRREVKSGVASFRAWEEVKSYASTEGVSYHSRIVHVGAGVDATAVAGGEVQRRSAPTSFGGDFCQSGWEFIRSLQLPTEAERVGREAVELLTAPTLPPSRTTLVLGSDQLALQVHESIGHATELDRILAMEVGLAGTSWVSASDRGQLRYGSTELNIVADATEPGGLGTFGWDDEGVAAQRVPLIEHGLLVGFLTSRETARQAGVERSGGTVRAESSARAPLIRMTNIDLLPGDRSFDELLDGVRDGVYMSTNRSWSIDDKRLNFQFGTEVARRIVNGELGGLLRNAIYSGMTPEFWGSLDAVGDRTTWHLWGVPNCGKGQPTQTARVGHGAPAGRFRNVAVRGR